eukprot:5534727-Pleurochrysis_carterae.AAC.2
MRRKCLPWPTSRALLKRALGCRKVRTENCSLFKLRTRGASIQMSSRHRGRDEVAVKKMGKAGRRMRRVPDKQLILVREPTARWVSCHLTALHRTHKHGEGEGRRDRWGERREGERQKARARARAGGRGQTERGRKNQESVFASQAKIQKSTYKDTENVQRCRNENRRIHASRLRSADETCHSIWTKQP